MTHDQDLARRLGETLHRRADALHDTPLDLLDVRGRATSIRRRRHAVVGVAAAAAVAAVVLPAVPAARPGATTGGSTSSPRRRSPRSRSRCPSTRARPPRGAAPRVPYVVVDARAARHPCCDLRPARGLPAGRPRRRRGLGRPGQGHARPTGITVADAGQRLRVVDGGGGPPRIAVREDGGHVAFTQYDGRGAGRWSPRRCPASRTTPTPTWRPAAARRRSTGRRLRLGRPVVVESDRPGHGPVLLPGGGRRRHHDRVRRLQPRRRARRRSPAWSPGRRSTPATAPARASWTRSPRTRTSCGRRATTSWGPSARTGGTSSGWRLLGRPRSPTVAILDATTGEPVVDFVSGNDARSAAAVSDVVWEDATTLLATVTQGIEQYVVRATIDGRVERVVGPAPSQMSTEYRFPTHPFG